MSGPSERLPILMALGGLILKRKEIAANIDRRQYELRKLVTELDAIDAAIREYKPGAKLKEIIRPRAFCGQQRLILLTLLQETGAALTARQLALGLMLHRGLPTTDLKLVRQTIQRCSLTLHSMKRQGEVERIKAEDSFLWRLPAPSTSPTPGDAA